MLLPVDDTQLFCEVVGSGSLILAIHGGPGLDHQYLRPWLDGVGQSARIVYFDLRGHGRSSGRETLANSTHATICDDIDALRRQFTTGPVILFGHSYGGFLALEYALRYPENVAGLILCSTAASAHHAGKAIEQAISRNQPAALASLQRTLAGPCESDEDLANTWDEILPLYFHSIDQNRSSSTFKGTIFSADGHNRGFFHWLGTYDVRARLAEIKAPVLILSGADDWINPPRLAGDELEAGLPRAEHVVFENSGHFPFVEEHDRFIAITGDWLERLP